MRPSTLQDLPRKRSRARATAARPIRTAVVVLVLLAGLLAFSGAALAATGAVLRDFVPGGTTGNGRGVAFDGTNLWYTIVGDSHIYKVTTTGTPLGSIAIAGGVASAGPLAWDGSTLWTADYTNPSSNLFQVDPLSGAVLGGTCDFVAANPGNPAVPGPKGISFFPDGLDFGGGTFWMSSESSGNPANWVAQLNTGCAILSSFIAPPISGTDGISGSAVVVDPFNGNTLWNAVEGDTNPGGSHIFQTDTLGAPTGPDFPAAHLTEDLAFDPVTFAPKCALWGNEATNGANHLTAYEVPCPEQPITATGTTISATEGAGFSGTVATFTDPDPNSTAGEYAATIDWGDLSSSAGTISGPTGGPFTVTGTHTYTEEGTDTVKVTITDIDTPSNTATATSTVNVADAAIAATCAASPVSPLSFSGPVANLTDANPFGTAADFTATIDWGDISSSAGTVSGPIGGPFIISGSHTYSTTGFFTITTTITDDGGSTATTTCTVLIFATSTGGNFVIGDGNSAVGTHVTFWGAKWAKLNTLTGGRAPSAFKGFENTPSSAPACGTSWSTGPGNSPPPPAGPLPAFMAVIVSSSISKSGSTISGDTPHVVVVQTNPGYAPNPGHAGTGKVVAIVC
jgi:hypothetical protein